MARRTSPSPAEGDHTRLAATCSSRRKPERQDRLGSSKPMWDERTTAAGGEPNAPRSKWPLVHPLARPAQTEHEQERRGVGGARESRAPRQSSE